MTARLPTGEKLATVEEAVRWHSAAELPDSDLSVLIYAPNMDEPVWIGWHDGMSWVGADGAKYPPGSVVAWSDLPAGAVP